MTKSAKLGIASVFLLGCSLAPAPFGFVSGVISCVLGFLAAKQGSRWWLVVPGTIIVGIALIVYLGVHGLYD